jgi:outer membrane protein OmpA-like peptidoglycan-associated protein
MTSTLCSASFERDKARPTRVDNEAKACLDDIAMELQRSSDARLALVGNAGTAESGKKYAAERAVNTKNYLVTDKGIDASRIMVYTGSGNARTVTTNLIPAGATLNDADDTPVDERAVKAVSRTTSERHREK